MINMINGDDSVDFFLVQLSGWSLVAAILYWWSFTLLLGYITFNLLIAIFVDSYISVKDGFADTPSMTTDLWVICRGFVRRRVLGSHYRTDALVQRELWRLGAMLDEQRLFKDDKVQSSDEHGPDICPQGKALPQTINLFGYACDISEVERAIKEAAEMKVEEGLELPVASDGRGGGDGLRLYTDELTHAIVAHCHGEDVKETDEALDDDVSVVHNGFEAMVEKVEKHVQHNLAIQDSVRVNQEQLERKMDDFAEMLAKVLEKRKTGGF
eukprot:TRINITY_DN1618_c0_g2_i1.p1 TRINITY_DN1618_c0_g2~~TRINITY_DN1618_c0_g2_i1.p1  ORF type:complete len:313 (+),score=49.57 TRINITY_DN1618_c0_g2_i1:134-940(+)